MPNDQSLDALYTLRAEDLTPEDLARWTGSMPGDDSILRKLTGPGPKLLKGPRGSGKSNYLKRAYYKLSQRNDVLVAYINYSKHLALEPLMLREERALELFRQWLIYKIIVGISDSLDTDAPASLNELAAPGRKFINRVQTSIDTPPDELPPFVSPSELLDFIQQWAQESGKSRTVLLMDDAAHAFMHQQQREFFEVFRALRSRNVACKAAIYPGVTDYSPFFNIGHEAEEIEAWIPPSANNYLPSMRQIFERRFPESLQGQVRSEYVDLAAHAAFGLPRNFLNILSDWISPNEDSEADSVSTPTLANLRDAVRRNSERVRLLFSDIHTKLPRYTNFVTVGNEFQSTMGDAIRATNRNINRPEKYVGVALSQPWDPDLNQVISLLEYAGVVRRIGVMSRGKERYDRVQLHTSLLIADNSLSLGRTPAAEDYNRALSRQSADDFVRRQPGWILTPDRAARCRLNLTPCPKCGSPRVSEDAIFCYKCGTSLAEESIYNELLEAPIERLTLTPLKLQNIRDHSSIRTIQDLLFSDAGTKLRAVPSIGPTWAARIKARAEEYVTL